MPLFPGDCELRQLLHIFKLLGTPTEEEWAGVSQLRDWHEFPNWRKQSLAEHFPTLEPAGVDLLDAMFIYDPADRITVCLRTVYPRIMTSLHVPYLCCMHTSTDPLAGSVEAFRALCGCVSGMAPQLLLLHDCWHCVHVG